MVAGRIKPGMTCPHSLHSIRALPHSLWTAIQALTSAKNPNVTLIQFGCRSVGVQGDQKNSQPCGRTAGGGPALMA